MRGNHDDGYALCGLERVEALQLQGRRGQVVAVAEEPRVLEGVSHDALHVARGIDAADVPRTLWEN